MHVQITTSSRKPPHFGDFGILISPKPASALAAMGSGKGKGKNPGKGKGQDAGPDKNHAKAAARRQVGAAIRLANLAAVGLEEGAQSSASAAVNEVAAEELSRETAKQREKLQLAASVPRAEVGAMKLASEAVLPMTRRLEEAEAAMHRAELDKDQAMELSQILLSDRLRQWKRQKRDANDEHWRHKLQAIDEQIEAKKNESRAENFQVLAQKEELRRRNVKQRQIKFLFELHRSALMTYVVGSL